MKTSDDTLNDLLDALEHRWKRTTGRAGKKTKSLIRRCLWAGANVHHFELSAVPQEVVMAIYQAMPDRFHMMRAQAVLEKQKKKKESADE